MNSPDVPQHVSGGVARRADRRWIRWREDRNPGSLGLGRAGLRRLAFCARFEILGLRRRTLDAGDLLARRVDQPGLDRPPHADCQEAEQRHAQKYCRKRPPLLGAGGSAICYFGNAAGSRLRDRPYVRLVSSMISGTTGVGPAADFDAYLGRNRYRLHGGRRVRPHLDMPGESRLGTLGGRVHRHRDGWRVRRRLAFLGLEG